MKQPDTKQDFCPIYQISDISFGEFPDHPADGFTASLTDPREVSLHHYLRNYLLYQRTDHSLDTTTNIFREVAAARRHSASLDQVVENMLTFKLPVTSLITWNQLVIVCLWWVWSRG